MKVVLSEDEIAALAVNRFRLPGVVVEAQLVRHYPLGSLMGHAIGSVRRVSEDDLKVLDPVSYSATQFIGKLGVERVYERSLHGQVGYQQVETDARGRVRKVLNVQPPVAGQNLTLQLDVRLQQAATDALGERRGAVVAIDPRTGGILAMVSNPGYDPNLFVTGISAAHYKELSEDRADAAVQPRDQRPVRARLDVQADGRDLRACRSARPTGTGPFRTTASSSCRDRRGSIGTGAGRKATAAGRASST